VKRRAARSAFAPLILITCSGIAAVAPAGCSRSSEAPSAPQPAATPPSAAPAAPSATAPKDEAQQIFASRCATCHGVNGAGNGPASGGLDPKPRNFHDPVWQASVTDEHIEQIIQYGGAAVGKSAAMPSNPDLTSKPEVVTALRAYVRSLKE